MSAAGDKSRVWIQRSAMVVAGGDPQVELAAGAGSGARVRHRAAYADLAPMAGGDHPHERQAETRGHSGSRVAGEASGARCAAALDWAEQPPRAGRRRCRARRRSRGSPSRCRRRPSTFTVPAGRREAQRIAEQVDERARQQAAVAETARAPPGREAQRDAAQFGGGPGLVDGVLHGIAQVEGLEAARSTARPRASARKPSASSITRCASASARCANWASEARARVGISLQLGQCQQRGDRAADVVGQEADQFIALALQVAQAGDVGEAEDGAEALAGIVVEWREPQQQAPARRAGTRARARAACAPSSVSRSIGRFRMAPRTGSASGASSRVRSWSPVVNSALPRPGFASTTCAIAVDDQRGIGQVGDGVGQQAPQVAQARGGCVDEVDAALQRIAARPAARAAAPGRAPAGCARPSGA